MARRGRSKATGIARKRLRPDTRYVYKPGKEKKKKTPSERYDFWKADYDTIK